MHESQHEQGLKAPGNTDDSHPGTKATLEALMEVQMAQLVVLQRIYDVQSAILAEMNEDRADEIFDAHEQGRLFGPDIVWVPEQL